MPVAEAMERISSAEFAEWIAFDQLDPFGESRADYRNAITASVIAQCHGNKVKADDFMPEFDGPRMQDPQEMQMIAEQAARIHNAKLKA